MNETATAQPRRARLNFARIDARCAELGLTTEEERAKRLGAGRVSLWRWRDGMVDIGIDRAAKIADRLGLALDEIVLADPKPPSPPPQPPKPPAGPDTGRPPAGPKERQR